MTARTVVATTLALVGCMAPGAGSSRREALNGGAPADGHPATVYLMWTDGFSAHMCSGSVVAPRVVVSALHCFTEIRDGWTVFTGPTGEASAHVVTHVLLPVGEGYENHDIAVLVTGTDIDVPAYSLRRDLEGLRIGDHVVLTGYGTIPDGSFGRKYTGDAELWAFGPVDEVSLFDNELMTGGAAACSGDSGGTIEDFDGNLLGVISRGPALPCEEATVTFATRVDRFAELVDEGVALSQGCVPQGPEVCDGVDNDCDGQADPQCVGLGGACAVDSDCVQALCATVDGSGVCATACDDTRQHENCPWGFFCASVGCGVGRCLVDLSSLGTGQPCASDGECTTGFCRDPGDGGGKRCLVHCQESWECGAGSRCAPVDNACGGACVAVDRPELLGVGQECEADGECASGTCSEDAEGRFCSQPCGDCPDGYYCASGVCARGEAPMDQGRPCKENEDCLAGLCAHWPDGVSCTTWCSELDTCPEQFECTAIPDGRSACHPTRSIVGGPCEANEDCLTGLCGHFADGADLCTMPCDAATECPLGLGCIEATGLSVCAPPAPGESTYGCGCTAPGQRSKAWAALVAMGFALLSSRRRRL